MASTEKLLRIVLKLEDQFSKEANTIAGSLDKLSGKLTSIGAGMTAAFTVPLAALGAAGVQAFGEFEQSLANISSVTGMTKEQVTTLGQSFTAMSQDLSKTTDSAISLSKAFYDIAGSGFAGEDAMRVLEVATKGATAGLTDTTSAAKALTQVLNSYNLEASESERVMDIMFQTVNRGVGTFEQLSGALSNVTGLASSLGIPFEEISAAMATLSKNGMTFAEASTSIRQAMTNMIRPTADGLKLIQEMGYASGAAMIDALGFAGAVQKIAEHTGNSTEEMAKLFSDVNGLQAVLGLTGDNATKFAEDLAAMNASAGATADAFAKQTDTFQSRLANFQNTFTNFSMAIGQALIPILDALMSMGTAFMNFFMSLPQPIQTAIVAFGLFIAAIGPVLIIFGQIAGAISSIMTVMPILSAAFAGLGAAISGFGSAAVAALLPFAPLIIAIVAASALLWAVATNFMGVRDKIQGAVQGIMDWLGKLAGAWGEMLSKASTALSQLGQIVWGALNKLTGGMLELGRQVIEGLINGIKSKAVDLVAYVFGLSNELTAAIKSALGIRSPSKVMMEMGENVVAGFHKGIESMGGVGVTVPRTNAMPTVSASPALAAARMGGGGGGTQIYNVYAAPGSTDQQVRDIAKKLGRMSKKRGAKGV